MCRCVGGRLLSDVCVCMWLSGCGCMRKQSSSHLTPISTRPTFTPIKHTSYSFYITISISFPMFAAYFLPVFVVITCCCSNSLQRLYILTIRMFFFFRLIFMSGGAKCVAPFGLFAFNDECCEAMFLPTDILYKYVRSYSCVSN